MFIVGGSFEGMERIIEQRLGRRSVGFARAEEDNVDVKYLERTELFNHLKNEDLERFGLIPEFIGRLPVIAVMNPLRTEDLVHILTEPKNALIKQYTKLFKYEKVKLRFSEGAIQAIAEKAQVRKAGARGLRAIIETVMLDVMYEVPSIEGVSEVLITQECVEGTGEPVFTRAQEYGLPG